MRWLIESEPITLFKQIPLDRSLQLPFKQHLAQATDLIKASAYLLELRAVVKVC